MEELKVEAAVPQEPVPYAPFSDEELLSIVHRASEAQKYAESADELWAWGGLASSARQILDRRHPREDERVKQFQKMLMGYIGSLSQNSGES